jgi:hypothetical protein
MKGAYFTVLAALRYFLAPIKDIVLKSLAIVLAILLVLEMSVSSYTVWDCVFPSMAIILVVLSLFKIEGSGIGERHTFPKLLDRGC